MSTADQAVRDIERMFGVAHYLHESLPRRRFIARWAMRCVARRIYAAMSAAVKDQFQ